jgi:predicted outer membrane repeat protein
MIRNLFLVASLAASQGAWASCALDICSSDCDATSLADAVEHVEFGSDCAITIEAGTYTVDKTSYIGAFDNVSITANGVVTFDMQGGSFPLLTVDAGADVAVAGVTVETFSYQVFEAKDGATLSLEAVTIDGTNASSLPGLVSTDADVILIDVDFSNQTGTTGGAALINGGTISDTDGLWQGNSSSSGGAIQLINGAIGDFEGTTFLSNFSYDLDGGAVYAYDATLNFSNVTFDGNEAAQSGGAVAYDGASNGTPYLDDQGGQWSNNSALGDGGAIWASFGDVFLQDSVFIDNTADGDGGAVSVTDGALTPFGASFEDNLADGSGGALHWYNTDTWIQDAFGKGNIAASNGGFGQGSRGTLTLYSTVIIESQATSGGALFAEDVDELYMSQSAFCQNEATGFFAGGVQVSLTSSAEAVLVNNFFVENDVGALGTGGGLLLESGLSADISNNMFVGNDAATGGGLRISKTTSYDLYNNIVAFNSGGDGASFHDTAASTWDSNLFHDNGTVGTEHVDIEIDDVEADNYFDIDPLFFDYTANDVGTHECVELHLGVQNGKVVSPVVDAGIGSDSDGSEADLGPYGGSYVSSAVEDNDGDFSEFRYDCNDSLDAIEGSDLTGADVNPFATEVCDGVDNDCDGLIDEDDDDLEADLYYFDSDGDGTPVEAGAVVACSAATANWVVWNEDDYDCNDNDDDIYPGADEICDDDDNDCDDLIDDADDDVDPDTAPTWIKDKDDDTYGAGNTLEQCSDPGSPYIEWDAAAEEDCDDTDDDFHPGANEVCDGEDNDCDELIDDDDASLDLTTADTWYVDDDEDSYGDDDDAGTRFCDNPGSKYSQSQGDCDDGDEDRNDGAQEVCGGTDEDCDGVEDDDDPTVDDEGFTTYYPDDDDDGYGVTAGATDACSKPKGFVKNDDDCDDDDKFIAPGAIEGCDYIDNNCDGQVDEDESFTTWYADVDSDGYGDKDSSIELCDGDSPGTDFFVEDLTDCDDDDDLTNPASTSDECIDAVDRNCDGIGGSSYDHDGDTLTWDEEQAKGSDPCKTDTDGDGIPDDEELDTDSDGDTKPNVDDADDDGDGIPTADERSAEVQDPDEDGIANYLDTDSDGDGSADGAEGDGDIDNNGVPNYLDSGSSGDATAPSPESGKSGLKLFCSTSTPGALWLGLLLMPLVRRRRE